MLVLQRKRNEVIRVTCGDAIIDIVMVEFRNNNGSPTDGVKARIGISAPEHVQIDRLEIWERKNAKG